MGLNENKPININKEACRQKIIVRQGNSNYTTECSGSDTKVFYDHSRTGYGPSEDGSACLMQTTSSVSVVSDTTGKSSNSNGIQQ